MCIIEKLCFKGILCTGLLAGIRIKIIKNAVEQIFDLTNFLIILSCNVECFITNSFPFKVPKPKGLRDFYIWTVWCLFFLQIQPCDWSVGIGLSGCKWESRKLDSVWGMWLREAVKIKKNDKTWEFFPTSDYPPSP